MVHNIYKKQMIFARWCLMLGLALLEALLWRFEINLQPDEWCVASAFCGANTNRRWSDLTSIIYAALPWEVQVGRVGKSAKTLVSRWVWRSQIEPNGLDHANPWPIPFSEYSNCHYDFLSTKKKKQTIIIVHVSLNVFWPWKKCSFFWKFSPSRQLLDSLRWQRAVMSSSFMAQFYRSFGSLYLFLCFYLLLAKEKEQEINPVQLSRMFSFYQKIFDSRC